MTLIFPHSDREAAATSISLVLGRHVSQTISLQPLTQRLNMHMPTVYILSCIKYQSVAVVLHSCQAEHLLANGSAWHSFMLVLYILYFHRHSEVCPHIHLGHEAQVRTHLLSNKQAHTLTHTLTHRETHTITLVALAQIRLCYNNPIWDGLDSHSESTHIMML